MVQYTESESGVNEAKAVGRANMERYGVKNWVLPQSLLWFPVVERRLMAPIEEKKIVNLDAFTPIMIYDIDATRVGKLKKRVDALKRKKRKRKEGIA